MMAWRPLRVYTEIEALRHDLYFDDTGEAITELNTPLLARNDEELGRKLGNARFGRTARVNRSGLGHE